MEVIQWVIIVFLYMGCVFKFEEVDKKIKELEKRSFPMARTIGKVKIMLIKKITKEEMKRGNGLGSPDYSGVRDYVREKLPATFWDIWEGADTEIDNIIDKVISDTEH